MKMGILTILGLLVSATTFAQTNWTERFNFKGDLRIRGDFESGLKDTTVGEYERNRMRLRARFQTTAKVNDNTDAILRFATGNLTEANTTSTNQDMTDFASKKGLNLDMAYANWKPNETAQVWLGKAPVAYYQPGNSDMVFDPDLTPEGISYKDSWKGESTTIFWNLNYWMLDEYELTPRRIDVTGVGGDVGVVLKMGDVGVTLGGGVLNFANIKGATVATSGAKGNSNSGGVYTNKYELTRGFLEIAAPVGSAPLALYFDYVQNEDPSEDNKGSLVGIKWGKLKDVGSWTVSADRRDVEADATLGIIAESDTGGGGVGLISNRLALGYQLADGTASYLHVSNTERRNKAESDYQRIMFDLVYNF